jgi:hypothetical protein
MFFLKFSIPSVNILGSLLQHFQDAQVFLMCHTNHNQILKRIDFVETYKYNF